MRVVQLISSGNCHGLGSMIVKECHRCLSNFQGFSCVHPGASVDRSEFKFMSAVFTAHRQMPHLSPTFISYCQMKGKAVQELLEVVV